MIGDLAAFIAARLGEDEAAAKAAAGPDWHADSTALTVFTRQQASGDRPGVRGIAWCSNGYVDDDANVHHIARHDPARVLREVAAKRVILELHDRVHDCPVVIPVPDPSAFPGTLGYVSTEHIEEDEPDVYPCTTLRQLAAVWDGHPDYRQEWKP